MSKLLFEEETYKLIGAGMTVHKNLGNGFLESVYQKVLAKEFRKEEIPFTQQQKLNLFYEEEESRKSIGGQDHPVKTRTLNGKRH